MYKPDLRFLQAELKRVSDLIQLTDRKSAFLVTFYTAIAGLILTQKSAILNNLSIFTGNRLWLYRIVILAIVMCFSSGVYYLIRSTFPSMKNEYSDEFPDYYSIIKYRKFSTEDELTNHLHKQIHMISSIANKKMISIHRCSKNLFILVFLVIIFVFLF